MKRSRKAPTTPPTPPAPATPRWTLSWVHLALALAFGAGLPVVWTWFEAGDRPAAAIAAAPAAATAVPVQIAAASPAPVQVAAATPAVEPAPAAAPPRAAPQIPRQRDPHGDQSPDITDFINQGEVPTMADVISRLRAAGVTGGLAAFNPPGTKPPLVGNAVSADFELPAGYVRHHQFTDDGRPIEAIVMFAPDHPSVLAAAQAAGRDELTAAERVVPPALLPPGLPVRQIVVPAPAEPGR
ncbi:MAG: hypothetical protein IT499_04985 [Rubrivivax sp.]|nr:hypothetical protein [Rubrivivax sp.]